METEEDSKRDDRYIQFPLCLIQKTYEDPKQALNIILDFGIVNYARKFDYDIHEVARQLMYAYFRKSELQKELKNSIQEYINNGSLTYDPDYEGFDYNTFDPADSILELIEIFETNRKFKRDAILYYQIKQAESFLNIKDYSIDRTIENYLKGLKYKNEFEEIFSVDCWPSVKVTQLIDFRDSGKDLDIFRAFVGIKSMIGRNTFITTNHPAILSRMIGCKNKAAFEYYTTNRYNKNKNLLPTVEKYSKRYHREKLLKILAERKFIMYLSKQNVSVIYLSSYMEPEELGELVKQAKKKRNLKERIRKVTACL